MNRLIRTIREVTKNPTEGQVRAFWICFIFIVTAPTVMTLISQTNRDIEAAKEAQRALDMRELSCDFQAVYAQYTTEQQAQFRMTRICELMADQIRANDTLKAACMGEPITAFEVHTCVELDAKVKLMEAWLDEHGRAVEEVCRSDGRCRAISAGFAF